MFSIESLSGLVAFSVAVEAGSFAAAGRKLGLSASAVGKAVERLEARLGVRLLNRTTRSLALTGEGEVLYRYVARILKDLQDAEQELYPRPEDTTRPTQGQRADGARAKDRDAGASRLSDLLPGRNDRHQPR
jgi:DNA-binding transcriptional LysR family regulator